MLGNRRKLSFCSWCEDRLWCVLAVVEIILFIFIAAVYLLHLGFGIRAKIAPLEPPWPLRADIVAFLWANIRPALALIAALWGPVLLYLRSQRQEGAAEFYKQAYEQQSVNREPTFDRFRQWLFHPNPYVRCQPLPGMETEDQWVRTLSLICLEADELHDSHLAAILERTVALASSSLRYPLWKDLHLLFSERWSCRSPEKWMEHLAAWPLAPHASSTEKGRPLVWGLQIWALAQLLIKVEAEGHDAHKAQMRKLLSEQPPAQFQRTPLVPLLLRDQRLLRLAAQHG